MKQVKISNFYISLSEYVFKKLATFVFLNGKVACQKDGVI